MSFAGHGWPVSRAWRLQPDAHPQQQCHAALTTQVAEPCSLVERTFTTLTLPHNLLQDMADH